MAVNEAQQAALSNAHAGKQDKVNPFVIRMTDGALLPNIYVMSLGADKKAFKRYRLANKPDMRVFTGDPKWPAEQRLRHAETHAGGRTQVTNSRAQADAFDVGKANRAELIAFAAQEFALTLDPEMSLKAMREKIMETASAEPAPDDLS